MSNLKQQAARGAHWGQEPLKVPSTNLYALNNSPWIHLHIAELVLHGFTPADDYRIGDSVELELTRLFAEQGVPPHLIQGREVNDLDGGSFEAPFDSTPEAIGVQIARAIHKGIGR